MIAGVCDCAGLDDGRHRCDGARARLKPLERGADGMPAVAPDEALSLDPPIARPPGARQICTVGRKKWLMTIAHALTTGRIIAQRVPRL